MIADSPERLRFGTAGLVHVEKTSVGKELYFLTNEHLLEGLCSRTGPCPDFVFVQNTLISGDYVHELGSTKFSAPEVIKISTNPDLALIKVISQGEDKLRPLSFTKKCGTKVARRLYSVGFSNTSRRTYKERLFIEEQMHTFKRWSTGLEVGSFNHTMDGERHLLQGTTVDALPGGSGGPVFDEKGDIVGIMQSSASVGSNLHRYDGNEDRKKLDWTSLIVRCDVMKNFLKDVLPEHVLK